jgi:hypothetical protein
MRRMLGADFIHTLPATENGPFDSSTFFDRNSPTFFNHIIGLDLLRGRVDVGLREFFPTKDRH